MTSGSNSEVRVSILIVSYKNPDDVLNCMRALQKQTYVHFDVVICENGGEEFVDDIKKIISNNLEFFQPITVISLPDNPGFAGAVNLCLKQTANASAWWILNPDTEPSPDALQELLGELESGEFDAVGSTLLRPDGRIQSQGGVWQPMIGRAVSIGYGRKVDSAVSHRRVTKLQNYLNGASMLVNSSFVDRVGLMREDYFLYCEEVEWFLRAKSLDIAIGYAKDSIVLHNQGSTTGAGRPINNRSKLSVYLSARNSILLMYDLNRKGMPLYAVFSLIYLILKYTKACASQQLLFALGGWFSGLQNQRGKPKWLI